MRKARTPMPDDDPASRRARLLVVLCLLVLYIVWGSTYLAISFGLRSYPPFTLAATRFLTAGSILYAFLRWRGVPGPTLRQWLNAALCGFLLLAMGNGLVVYAQQTVASGLAAIAVATMPLFAALFAGLYGFWPRRMEWLGLVVGFSGVIALNLGGGMSGSVAGTIALIVAPAAWAFGSVWSRRQDMPRGVMNTAAQMLGGGAALLLVALATGERWPVAPTLPATLGLAYLVVVGSLVAFSAYLYLLANVRPALATSYAYVNPPVAVALGVLFAGESVRLLDLASMAVILAGVGLITLAQARAHRGDPS